MDARASGRESTWQGKSFAPEFRQQAVRLYRVSGRPFNAVAGELAISPESLRRCVLQAEIDEGKRNGLTSEEREEFGRLRRDAGVCARRRRSCARPAVFFARTKARRVLWLFESRQEGYSPIQLRHLVAGE
jgi:transposase